MFLKCLNTYRSPLREKRKCLYFLSLRENTKHFYSLSIDFYNVEKEVMGVDYWKMIERWMKRRVKYATREELRGFVCHPMHSRMVELATEEIERRREGAEGDN